MDVIKGEPTPGLTYNPNHPVYWDKTALKGEIDRVYEICNGCRLNTSAPSPRTGE